MLARKIGEFSLKEDQTNSIFEQLYLGITLKVFFHQKISHPADRRIIVTCLAKNRARFLNVKIRERPAPSAVASQAFRIVSSGDFPASEVLTVRGKSQWLRCVLVQVLGPVIEALMV
jgi:hypothetical protein